MLRKYDAIWEDYKAKYDSFPMAQDLQQARTQREQSHAKLQHSKEKVDNLKTSIEQTKQEKGRDTCSHVQFLDMY